MTETPKPGIFITGAASGIGRATAELFAARGWFVGLYDVNLEGVEALQATLGADKAVAGRLDVSDSDAWHLALKEFTQACHGRLDVLVNNAGILATGNFQDIPLATHHKIVDINLNGVLNGCHEAFPFLKATPGARIINIASASAIYGTPVFASYSSTKFAVRGLTEALNLEWQDHDIRVSDIMPIFVKTHMTADMHTKSSDKMGINLSPEDIAATVWKAANRKGFSKVHWPVGAQTHQLMFAMRLLPTGVARAILRKLSL